MADGSMWLKCGVVMIVLAWYSSGLFRWLDGYYRNRFLQYIELEKMRNPHLEVPTITENPFQL